MRSLIVGLLTGAILGSIAGFAAGIVTFPFVFPRPAVDAPRLDGSDRNRNLIATGTFIQADPADPMVYGSGGVSLYENLVRLGQDFEVAPGPKYHLYLVPDADITPETRVEESMFVDLGPLRDFRGSQSYPMPAGTDPTDYKSAVVWCEQLNLLISPATLRFP